MEKNEPTLGDLSKIEFRPKLHRGPVPQPSTRPIRYDNSNGMVWKIALGVFVGLCLFGLVTCSGLVIVGYAVQAEQEKQAQAAVDEFMKVARDPDPLGWRRAEIERQQQEAQSRALQPGERCIGGKRLRRVDNGWVQVQKPC